MQDARIRAALIAICLACLLGSGAALVAGHRTPPPVIITSAPAQAGTVSTPPVTAETARLHPTTRLYIDVAGAVRRPSLYVLPSESRVMQAIAAAGGPAAGADLDAINLAQKLTDGEKVYVPSRVTASLAQSRATASLSLTPYPSRVTAKETQTSHSNKLTADSGQQIALNTATAEELERLPGVGPAMAGRILAYRTQAGGFGKVEDLMQVTGIGPKKFAKIAPCVKLN